MIGVNSIILWLTILNAVILLLYFWCLRNQFNKQLRLSFLVLLTLAACFVNLVLILQWPGLTIELVDLLLRFTFASAFLIFIVFGFFCLTFAENYAQRRSIIFWSLVLNKLVLLLLLPSGYILSGAMKESYGIKPQYGPLHPYVVATVIIFGIYIFAVTFSAYRKSTNLFLRFQLKGILIAGIVSFVLISFTNGILPLFYESSKFSPTSSIATVFFLSGSLFVIVQGRRQFLLSSFGKVIGNGSLNFIAINQYIEALSFVLNNTSEPFNRQVNFQAPGGLGDNRVSISNQHTEGNEASSMSHAQIQGLIDTCLSLNSDNKRMFIALSRFQEEYNDLIKAPVAIGSSNSRIPNQFNENLSQVSKHVKENQDYYGEELIAYSKQRLKLLKEIDKLTVLKTQTLILGEPQVGKRTIAKALAFRQGFKRFREIISGQPIVSLSQQISETIETLKTDILQAVIIADIDVLDQRSFQVIAPLIDLAHERGGIYFTADISLAARLQAKLPALFARLYQNILTIPSLRECKDDIEPLLVWYANKAAKELNVPLLAIAPTFIESAREYTWPGNVGELIIEVQKSVLNMTFDQLEHPSWVSTDEMMNTKLSPLELAEKSVIFSHLQANKFNKNKTARDLNITINTLNSKIEKYHITV